MGIIVRGLQRTHQQYPHVLFPTKWGPKWTNHPKGPESPNPCCIAHWVLRLGRHRCVCKPSLRPEALKFVWSVEVYLDHLELQKTRLQIKSFQKYPHTSQTNLWGADVSPSHARSLKLRPPATALELPEISSKVVDIGRKTMVCRGP